tara:strand:+ start:415 stop:687 length:273 start_codon:yes stop_codon:yes gene_type:complete
MINNSIYELDKLEIKKYIFNLQIQVKEHLLNHNDIDDFLDKTNIFDEFEKILSDQEFGILVLTVLNDFKSEVIVNDLVDIIDNAIRNNNK